MFAVRLAVSLFAMFAILHQQQKLFTNYTTRLFTEDFLTCPSKKHSGVSNNMNYG